MQNVRQFGKCILEQVSNTRGLASGLKFLSSSTSSLSTIFLGLKHALKLVSVRVLLSRSCHLMIISIFFFLFLFFKEKKKSTFLALLIAIEPIKTHLTSKLCSLGVFL